MRESFSNGAAAARPWPIRRPGLRAPAAGRRDPAPSTVSGLTQLSEMLLQLFFQVVGGTSDVGRNHFIVGDAGISPERAKRCLHILRTCSLEQGIAMVQGEIRKEDPREAWPKAARAEDVK